ncbi:MAG TPA: clostripain-related cysteine peptidase, partial [Fluviicoccus sp.]|nr:clostripain-related cysteine peptidase [Fluviicoccus sp.]
MLSLLRIATSGALLLMLAACGGGGGGSSGGGVTPPAAMADWTYMVYIAGDNNLSSAAIDDINEMEQAGSSDRVNIVVQAEFSDRHTPYVPGISKSTARDGIGISIPGVSVSPTFRGRITKDNDTTWINSDLFSLGANLDMGKPQTLTDFIVWSKQQYPARNYALVLWSHGDGWKVRRSTGGVVNRGALADDSSGSFMALPDIAGAIRNAGVNLHILNFDACLMGMYEVAHTFVGLSEYLVASEEVEPGDGDDYQSVLTVLK